MIFNKKWLTKSKIRLLFIVMGFLVVIAFLVSIILTATNKRIHRTMDDMNKISYEELFNKNDDKYFVYFYQDECIVCKEIKDEIIKYSKKGEVPIYALNMGLPSNEEGWYEWEKHHEQFDKEIGIISENGEKEFFNGDTEEKYVNDTEVNWEIINEDSKIIAKNNTPYINIDEFSNGNVKIATTPSMILVENNKFKEFYPTVTEIFNELNTYY